MADRVRPVAGAKMVGRSIGIECSSRQRHEVEVDAKGGRRVNMAEVVNQEWRTSEKE